MEKDQEFVEFIVKSLVDTPEKVKVNRSVDEMGVLISLAVDPADMGKVIGKEGRTAKSIRTLLRVLGAKNNARVNLKIEEPEGGRQIPVEEKHSGPHEYAQEPEVVQELPVEEPKPKESKSKADKSPKESEEGPVTELV